MIEMHRLGAVNNNTILPSWTVTYPSLPSTTLTLRAAAGNGSVYMVAGVEYIRSTDNGVTWAVSSTYPTGECGRLISNGSQFIALTTTGIWYSDDGGDNWTQSGYTSDVSNFTYAASNGSTYVVVFRNSADVLTSSDGINWTTQSSVLPFPDTWRTCSSNGTNFVASGRDGTAQPIYATSSDGITWSGGVLPIFPSGGFASVLAVATAGKYIGLPYYPNLFSVLSTDSGSNWSFSSCGQLDIGTDSPPNALNKTTSSDGLNFFVPAGPGDNFANVSVTGFNFVNKPLVLQNSGEWWACTNRSPSYIVDKSPIVFVEYVVSGSRLARVTY